MLTLKFSGMWPLNLPNLRGEEIHWKIIIHFHVFKKMPKVNDCTTTPYKHDTIQKAVNIFDIK